jgi:hypothetical protein
MLDWKVIAILGEPEEEIRDPKPFRAMVMIWGSPEVQIKLQFTGWVDNNSLTGGTFTHLGSGRTEGLK